MTHSHTTAAYDGTAQADTPAEEAELRLKSPGWLSWNLLHICASPAHGKVPALVTLRTSGGEEWTHLSSVTFNHGLTVPQAREMAAQLLKCAEWLELQLSGDLRVGPQGNGIPVTSGSSCE